jgi:signal transduction histidine kinase
MELHRRRAPPAELITQAVHEARRSRPAQDQLLVELQAGLEPISCDPLRLTQAVTHLAGYALDAAKGREIVLRARDGEMGNSRAFVIELEYDGEIGEEERQHLFDPFQPQPDRPGLHLALPLARRLLELHGGTLEISAGARPRFIAAVPVARRRERTTPTSDLGKIS